MKKIYLFVALMMVAAFLLSALAPADASVLHIRNKVPGEKVMLRMTGIRYGYNYYLTAEAPTAMPGPGRPTSRAWIRNSFFDVRKDIYEVTIYFCGGERSGTLNLMHNVRLVFASCYGVPNAGEPAVEKVSVSLAIPGTCNVDDAGDPGDGYYPWGCGVTPAGFATNGDQIWWRLDWYNWWNGNNDVFEPFWP